MMPFRPSRRALLASAPLLAIPLGGGIAAPAGSDFNQFLAEVRRDAIARGIRPATIEAAFQQMAFLPRVVELDRKQPEHKMTFAEYFQKVVTTQRIDEARQKLVENWALLQRVWQQYRVQPRFVVTLWGVESNFGRAMGTFNVPAALATLAYEGRRGAMFRTELLAALKILDQGNVAPAQMVGRGPARWASASSCRRRISPTPWISAGTEGATSGTPRRTCSDRSGTSFRASGGAVMKAGDRWLSCPAISTRDWPGSTPADRYPNGPGWGSARRRGGFSGGEPAASLVLPDGPGGTALLVYDNFRAIKKWNNSNYFAAAVGYIADSIGSG